MRSSIQSWRFLFAVAALAATFAWQASAEVSVDENLPAYEATSGISGNLTSVGSDTLNNLMAMWTEQFKKHYPNVTTQVKGEGSTTAPPALTAGTSQLGPMSRPMKAEEVDKFEEKFGYKPTCIRVAVDALAVFVNKDNPVKGLTFTQVDGIFSATRKRGGEEITKWGQVGLTGDWANRPISTYGRNAASGTYGYFKEHALKKGDFKDTVKEQPGSAAVVQSVTSDRFAIGYSGIGYATPGVCAVPLANKDGGEFIEATPENAYAGKYPLARFLYIYINKAPGKSADPIVKEFIKFVLSKEGQEVVVKDGYFPTLPKFAEPDVKLLD